MVQMSYLANKKGLNYLRLMVSIVKR